MKLRAAICENLYECTPTSRDELRLQFPRYAKEIDGAKASEYRANQAYKRLQANDTIADMVDLYDCYHLGISAEKPGRRILALNNVTLIDEPWELNRFPYPRFLLGQRRTPAGRGGPRATP